MGKKAYEMIAEGLNEALAIVRGEMKPARVYVPSDPKVKAIRQKLGLTQEDFATQFGFSLNQIRDWEQHRSRPLGGVRSYLFLIESHPDQVRNMLRSSAGKMQAAE